MAWGRKTTAAQTPAWSQDDYHTDFAAKIKDQIAQGVAPWQKPWKPGERRLPENLQSGKPYRGGNSVYLSVAQTAKGYSDHRWATYKQIKDMGGQVRKGEKATHVLFYKFDDEKEKPQPGAPDTPATSPDGAAEKDRTRPPMVRCYAVFNVAQADGLQLERQGDDRENEPECKAHQTAERVIQESGIRVVHERGDRAFYNLHTDKVTLTLGYVTSFSTNATLDSPGQMMGWLLIVLPLMVAGVMSALKVGELAGMLVSGGGAGMTGALMMAATGGKAALAGKAVGK